MIPVEEIITQETEKLKKEITRFFEGEDQSVDAAEAMLKEAVENYICGLMTLFYEKLDDALLEDKAGRKAAGLVIERRKDRRQILSQLGTITFHRSYFAKKDGGYCYPVDAVAGLEGYERVSLGVATGLCEKARRFSYAESSNIITSGAVTKQTVMNKVRMVEKQEAAQQPRRCVPVLHIDADEDHISLQDGTSTIAPLVSVYEGIDKQNKRHYCRNIVHYPFFETAPDDIWENVLESIETSYDLTNTKIYVHGDGAPWIQKSKEWLPDVTFVLDRYHYNKYKKQVLACLDAKQRGSYWFRIQTAILRRDEEKLIQLWKELLEENPEREEALSDAFLYLLNNLDAIAVYDEDPEAGNGGSTEPHVSHVLSERLSMKPLGWSRETLRHFVPFLGTGIFELRKSKPEVLPVVQEKATAVKSHMPVRPKFNLSLPDPDTAIEFPAMSYKVTELFRALKSF